MVPEITNYTIQREIGVGGMAVVYEATDDRLQRTVAIKVLHPHLCREPSASDRFIREARAAAKIDHPNVVRLYDYSSGENLHYIVMEYVPGSTLERVLKERGPVSPENAVAIMTEIAEALAQAHAIGIIHRDVKPANILLHRQGRAMLSDFGLAHHLPDSRLTTPDAVAGTPSYMSPEQISGSELSAATDIYSWGICLYAIITGKLPYGNDTYPEVLSEIRRGAIRFDDTLLEGLSFRHQDLLLRCLTADPQQRIGDARELLSELDRCGNRRQWLIDVTGMMSSPGETTGAHPSSRPSATMVLSRKSIDRRYFGSGAVILLLVIASAVFFFRPQKRLPNDNPAGTEMMQPEADLRNDSIPGEVERSDTIRTAAGQPGGMSDTTIQTTVAKRISGEDTARPVRKRPSETVVRPVAAGPSVAATVDSGAFFIFCEPWANVRVGDRELGATPFEKPVPLPVGRHVVSLSNGFCIPLTDTVVITAGTVLRKRYRLQVAE
ncbi:MAG: serine/threonine protein kinase [Chitinispirillaceae bacterium]|nr:serine/threonine protein kinase [Chitinispirillaceae bacterium]